MKKIIIDCDPGHDDILAILIALANKDKLDIIGITTVAGNQTLEKVTNNTLNFMSYIKEDVPIVKGCESPILKEKNIGDGHKIHGESGLGGFDFPKPNLKLHSENAIKFIYDKLMSEKEKITLVPTAPLTNIGLLLKTFPEVKEKIECISLMGGSIYSGNITPSAEYNIYADPDAAKIVFESGVPIIMSGLEVTHKSFITLDEVDEMLRKEGKVSQMIGGLLKFYGEYFKGLGLTDLPLHDACAVLYLIHPEIFKGEKYKINVETNDGITRGKTVADIREWRNKDEDNVLVVIDIDRKKFMEYVISTISYFDNKLNNI